MIRDTDDGDVVKHMVTQYSGNGRFYDTINHRCKSVNININIFDKVQLLIDMTPDILNDFKSIVYNQRIILNRTALWIVTGNNRKNVADMIATRLITLDVFNGWNFDASSYFVSGYPELLHFPLDIIRELRMAWLLYVKDWDASIKDKNTTILQSLIEDRIDMSAAERNGHPTIVTVADDNTVYQKLRDNNMWTDKIRVVKTK